jgi:hypothetical protein
MKDLIIGAQNKWLLMEFFRIGKIFFFIIEMLFSRKKNLFRITENILACSRPTVRHADLKQLFYE